VESKDVKQIHEGLIIRGLARDEIESVWEIDRSEIINGIYHLQDGELVLEEEHFDAKGWPPGIPERYTPVLYDCFDRGGTFYGAFDGPKIAGAAVLESKFIGEGRDQLQLKFLHVSGPYRKRGLGRALFEMAVEKAREMKARRLYISATPSENTVGFYMHLGCVLAREINPELFELEPEDIHLEYAIP